MAIDFYRRYIFPHFKAVFSFSILSVISLPLNHENINKLTRLAFKYDIVKSAQDIDKLVYYATILEPIRTNVNVMLSQR